MNATPAPGYASADETPEDPVSDAEAAVAALAESFVEWITEDIARARAALGRAQASPGDNREDLRAIFEVMHNVKGQGSSFGYNLLTKIGGSLCNYIREASTSADEKQLRVVAAHFAAMDFVLDKKVLGDGGEIGKQITGKLDQLIAGVPAPA